MQILHHTSMMKDLEEEVYDEMRNEAVFHDAMHGDLEIFVDELGNLTIMDRYAYVILDASEADWMIRTLQSTGRYTNGL